MGSLSFFTRVMAIKEEVQKTSFSEEAKRELCYQWVLKECIKEVKRKTITFRLQGNEYKCSELNQSNICFGGEIKTYYMSVTELPSALPEKINTDCLPQKLPSLSMQNESYKGLSEQPDMMHQGVGERTDLYICA